MPDSTFLAIAWPFVHPGIAAAAGAAALIPLLIHLINRRRFRKMPWAAMSFLAAANRRSARRVRLEHFVLLLTRMILVVLLGLAIARPYVRHSQGAGLGLGAARVHRMILLDNSLSMQATRPDGRTRFEAASGAAQKLVSLFPQGDGLSLITTAQPAEVLIGSPTYDRRMAKEMLGGIRPTQKADDVITALGSARQLLATSEVPPDNRAVYLISDFAEPTWHVAAGEEPSGAVAALASLAKTLGDRASSLYLVRVEPGSTENLAITDFRPESTLVSVQMPVPLIVDIHNFGPSTVRGANLQLRNATQTIRREPLPPLLPGTTRSAVVTASLSAPGIQRFEARVTSTGSDSLPLDDSRWLSLDVRDRIPVLIVDGSPGARLIDGQAGYLATALAPREESSLAEPTGWTRTVGNIYDVKVISEPELRTEMSDPYEVIALCNVRSLPAEQWSALEAYAKNGGGVFIALGSLVNADNYNRYGYSEGKGLLPARLEGIRDGQAQGTRLGFDLGGEAHGLLQDFIAHPSSGLFSARVDRYYGLNSVHPAAEIPLPYTDHAAALVMGRHGQGRVALWTTTVNMEWNNLPGRGDFVAVMVKIFAALLPQPGQHRNLLVGQSLLEPLSPSESTMLLKVLSGEEPAGTPELVASGEGLAAQFGPVASSGALDLAIGQDRREFAVNVDPSESALASAEEGPIATWLGKSAVWVREDNLPTPAPAKSVELALALLWFVLGLLLLELWLAQRFSAPHPGLGRTSFREGGVKEAIKFFRRPSRGPAPSRPPVARAPGSEDKSTLTATLSQGERGSGGSAGSGVHEGSPDADRVGRRGPDPARRSG